MTGRYYCSRRPALYENISWASTRITWETLDETKVNEMEAELARVTDANASIHASLVEKMKDVRETIKSIFGEKSNEYKYVKKIRVPSPPEWNSPRKTWECAVSQARNLREEKRRELESDERIKAKVERAVIWLIERGLVLGTDFSIANAWSKANEIAFKEAIEKVENEGTWHEFIGSESCEPDCLGWDGRSKRCDCGSRRVGWMFDEDADFEDAIPVPEAY